VTKEQDKILQLEEQYSSKYIKHARENLKVLARAFSRGSRAHTHRRMFQVQITHTGDSGVVEEVARPQKVGAGTRAQTEDRHRLSHRPAGDKDTRGVKVPN
jgi:hypothetical protein